MATLLIVPIHLDALFLPNDRLVVEATANFARLPYIDRNLRQEINADTANISEEIISQPFDNQNLSLKAGIHLHWALPDALTKGRQDGGRTQFPQVPDRWLVIRRNHNQQSGDGQPLTQAWVVESNYVYTPKSCKAGTATSHTTTEPLQAGYVPYTQDLGARSGSVSYYYPSENYDEPFRFVGRKLSLELWLQEESSTQAYLETITAIGYGEPTFAAFYPNCHSILGFHDDELTQSPGGFEYEVVGWYSNTEQDFIKSLAQQILDKDLHSNSDATEVFDLLQKHCRWSITGDDTTVVPERMLCYGKLNFETRCSTNAVTFDIVKNLEVAVGNTPMEALSAYLANQLALLLGIDPSDRQKMEKLEDQMELMHLASYLENQELDLAQTCKAIRHETGFQPVAIDPQWTIQAGTTSPNLQDRNQFQSADANDAQTQGRLILPLPLMQQLRALNSLQRQYTKNQNEISARRKQIFSDWYKFMLASYPPQDANRGDDYPDIDTICHFIETQDITPLAYELELEKQLKTQLDQALNMIQASLDAYNHSTVLRLKVEAAQQGKGKKAATLAVVPEQSEYYALSGSPQLIPDPTKTFDYCLSFDGLDDYCELKNLSSQFPHKSLALSLWFKKVPQSSTTKYDRVQTLASQALVTLQTTEEFQLLYLCLREDNRLCVAQGENKRFAPNTLPSDRWHHLTLNCEPFETTYQITIYVNGKRQMQFKTDCGVVQSIQISCLNPTSGLHPFKGHIAQVCLDNRVLSAVEVARENNRLPRIPYLLQQTLDQRYWQPNEPVILMTGDDIKPTQRYGQDGRHRADGTLACTVISEDNSRLQALLNRQGTDAIADTLAWVSEFGQTLAKTLAKTTSAAIALQTWNEQPWNPILMEWEVQMQPAQTKTNVTGSGYAHDVITENYTLADGEIDLEIKQNRRNIGAGKSYSNACILTSQAGNQFIDKIKAYLDKNLFDRTTEYEKLNPEEPYHRALQIWYRQKPARSGKVDELIDIAAIKQWYLTKPLPAPRSTHQNDQPTNFPCLGQDQEQQQQDPVYIAILAYETLCPDGKLKYFLSQSLSGFNAELLMFKQTLQLPVSDPLSFDNYQQLTEKVNMLLGNTLCTAPEPLNQFSPVRSGAMKITRLRLVDTFGQVKEFNEEVAINQGKGVLTPQRLTVPHSPHLIWLPPRLVQPARLDFQWLSANEQDPNATPICGWILPDTLNRRLAVYDAQGKALGTIAMQKNQIQWESAPRSNRTVDELDTHLSQLIQHILSKSKPEQTTNLGDNDASNYLENLITAIESALSCIDPKNSAQDQSLALLVGRPLAVVRASLNIELQGEPAVNQSWHSFRLALNRTMRETDNFTRVQFPIRVGDHNRFNDGIICYWKEAVAGYEMDKVFLPKPAPYGKIQHPDIVSRNHQWILKKQFSENFQGSQATQVWAQLLEKGWLRSLNHDDSIARVELKDRLPLDKGFQHKEPQIEEVLSGHVINPLHIVQAIDSPPQAITMLMDPRGLLHATSGILPTKVIQLAPEDYIPALEAIEITFLNAPILSPQGARSLPLPIEPGFTWSWLEHKSQISKSVFLDILQSQEDSLSLEDAGILWEHLLDPKTGWLKALDKTKTTAQIIPMGRRISEVILPEIASQIKQDRSQLEDRIEQLFWADISAAPIIRKSLFMQRLFDRLNPALSLEVFTQTTGQNLWNYLLDPDVTWLKLLAGNPTEAEVVPKENRVTQVLNFRPFVLNREMANLAGIVKAFLVDDRASNVDKTELMQHLFREFQPMSPFSEFTQTTGQQIWEHLSSSEVGWLKLHDDNLEKAEFLQISDQNISNFKAKSFNVLVRLPGNTTEILESVFELEKLSLIPSTAQAGFGKSQELREGWLVLSKAH